MLPQYYSGKTDCNQKNSRLTSLSRRAFDIAFVIVLLPLSLPAFLVIALAVKLDEGGPVFFVQERLGLDEVPFCLVKFRTMAVKAEEATGPRWAQADDPRITRVGRVLRKLRLDELPQLFNILKGDMSLIGPRPIRKYFADQLAQEIPGYRCRFLVKPGLTGWAQVNHDYAGSKEGQREKFRYEMFYLLHKSFRMDLLILLLTVKVMIKAKGI
jgi:lipopolysaccharide/colanic/teichoic acid biosynthesis glycosyltransferase